MLLRWAYTGCMRNYYTKRLRQYDAKAHTVEITTRIRAEKRYKEKKTNWVDMLLRAQFVLTKAI